MTNRLVHRLSRTVLGALVAVVVAAPVSTAAKPSAVPAPEPAAVAPLRVATTAVLEQRYDLARDGVRAAERMATEHGDQSRAAALRAMTDPDRQYLAFDGRDGGRVTEVFGDLSRAERIAVLVPGADTNLDTYERFRSGAVALRQELGSDRYAVVAWLGYATPGTVSPALLTTERADEAAVDLRAFLAELRTAKPGAVRSLLCHSYGSVVCARAARDLPVDDIVLYGTPGAGVDDVGQLHTPATVWIGNGARDWVGHVPHVRLRLPFATVGFGPDPLSPSFGARSFDPDSAGHSDYLRPGSESLVNIARIVSGASSVEVSRAA